MRRFLLTLTVISIAGWSQPAQPQAQPPIPVKIEMPTESVWTALLKLAIPTMLGAVLGSGITLYGLRQTNKHNASENKANRQHEHGKLDREHSYTLKRDVLMRVTQFQVQTLAALKTWHNAKKAYDDVEEHEPDEEIRQRYENVIKAYQTYMDRQNELEQVTASARLAISAELWKLALAVEASIVEAHEKRCHQTSTRTKAVEDADKEITDFAIAAQKELGIVHLGT